MKKILIFSLLLLASCGFQLRGQITLPAHLKCYVATDSASSDMGALIQQRLADQNIVVVEKSEQAQVVLYLTEEAVERRVLSVSALSGKQEEVELNHRIDLEIKDQKGALLDKQHISLLRDFSFDATAVLAKDAEENILYQELKQEVAQQILRSLTLVVGQKSP
jgi:LPS-assembly lipoprotein